MEQFFINPEDKSKGGLFDTSCIKDCFAVLGIEKEYEEIKRKIKEENKTRVDFSETQMINALALSIF